MYTYTATQLEHNTFGQLKAIARELNIVPSGDRRCRQTWMDALVGVKLPLLALLETFPGVEADRVQKPIAPAAETSPFLVRNDRVRINSGLFSGMTGRVMRGGTRCTAQVEFDRRYEPSGVYWAFVGRDCLTLLEPVVNQLTPSTIEVQVQEPPIVPAPETSPGVQIDSVQEPIAPAAETSPGVTFSDRFLARYFPSQLEIHYQSDADGQLSLFDFEVESTDEPPDPDDFDCLDDFYQAMAAWDAENLEPLEISLDSMIYWAPCPEEWYWLPQAEDVKRCPCGFVPATVCNGSIIVFTSPSGQPLVLRCKRRLVEGVCGARSPPGGDAVF
ncbi:hypothetical protein QUB10_12615 [Microcoleus sp. B5-D4]|uniref:hypothetical protein n=1 Tax=unclassified Microcoleus TaxID=2642155 RepID=UPI002FCEB980